MKTRLLFALVALLIVAPHDAHAGLVYYNNFNLGSTSGTGASNEAALFTTTLGNGMMSTNFLPANVVSFSGTANNASNGDPAGAALALQNGTGNVNAGDYLQILTSTVGNSNLVLSFAIQATSTGFQSDQIQYTTDGGLTFNNFGNPFQPVPSNPTGFNTPSGLQTFDFSAITALNNNANAGFRIVFNLGGATGSASGNNRLDNIQINGSTAVAVPEPASIALVMLGMAGVGLIRRRKQA